MKSKLFVLMLVTSFVLSGCASSQSASVSGYGYINALNGVKGVVLKNKTVIPESTSAGHYKTGNALLDSIDSSSYQDKALALGYILGVKDALSAVTSEDQQMVMSLIGINRELENQKVVPEGAQELGVLLAGYCSYQAVIFRARAAANNPAGDNVTAGQLMDIVSKYLSDNPQERNQPAALLIWKALAALEGTRDLLQYGTK